MYLWSLLPVYGWNCINVCSVCVFCVGPAKVLSEDISLPYSPTCKFSNDQSLGTVCLWVGLLLLLLELVPSVLWRCWLGGRKGIRPVKNRVVGCWHGYLSGARCRLAYGPADATATHCLASGKANLDFTEARDSEWQWHQLGHMQVCTSLQTDNHASTPLRSLE